MVGLINAIDKKLSVKKNRLSHPKRERRKLAENNVVRRLCRSCLKMPESNLNFSFPDFSLNCFLFGG